MRGWTRAAIRFRASGALMELVTNLRILLWAFPWTPANEVRPTSSTVGHSCMNLSAEYNTNLLTIGVYTMMDGAPNRCVLNMPASSPYLFHCLSTTTPQHDNKYIIIYKIIKDSIIKYKLK